jgi:predicted RNase H-like HicB family nuclease
MKFKVVLYPSEEGMAVCAPSLPGCWSQGDTEEEALASIAVAIREYLEAEIEPDGTSDLRGYVREVDVAV